MNNKFLDLKNLKEKISKFNNKKIVFTNGCFDILHIGHIHYLYKASNLGDILIVGINSDTSVKQIKSDTRPIIGEKERAEVISALEMVDFVIIFNEPTCSSLLKEIKPDIYVKGGDYNPENLPEWSTVQEYGGKVKFVDLISGKSTSSIIKKIKEL